MADEFQPTQWSVVLDARNPGRATALNRLCSAYWRPVYAYLRRKGYSAPDAEDRVQGFFAHFLEKRLLERVEEGRGRFRSYLLTVLEYFLANEYRREHAAKRSGPVPELRDAEAELPAVEEPPERAYRRSWTLAVLQQAFDALRKEFEARGLPGQFDAVRAHLSAGEERPAYDAIAARLGVSVADVTNLLHRSRNRLRELIRSVLRETVESEADVESEVRELFS